jgi:hypothetical protein
MRCRTESLAPRGNRYALASRVKQDKPGNEDPQRFVKPNTAVNGIANGKTFIQPKCLSD